MSAANGGLTLAPILRTAPPNYMPAAVGCRGTFCLRLDIGDAYGTQDSYSASDATSTDGGATWHVRGTVPADLIGPEGFYAAQTATVSCTSSHVCLARLGSALLRTADAGAAWTTARLPDRAAAEALSCTSAGCLVLGTPHASSTERAYWSASGTGTFTASRATLPALFDLTLSCAGPSRCVLAGSNGDGGGSVYAATRVGATTTWARLSTSATVVIDDLACPTTTECQAVETVTAPTTVVDLASSSNGGASFVRHGQLGAGDVGAPSIACASAMSCVAADAAQLPRSTDPPSVDASVTTDGGTSWTSSTLLAPPATGGIYPVTSDVACAAAATCVVDVGALNRDGGDGVGGAVLRSTDLKVWTPIPSPYVPTSILSVECTTEETCLEIQAVPTATAFAAQLRVSSDDGTSWRTLTLPAGDEPVVIGGCQSSSSCEVVAVRGEALTSALFPFGDPAGATMVLLTTSNGGSSWTTDTASPVGTVPLQASCGAPTQCSILAYAPSSTAASETLRSTDDATTWTSLPIASDISPWLAPVTYGEAGVDALGCAPGAFCLLAGGLTTKTSSDVFASSDGGTSFSHVAAPSPNLAPLAVSCPVAEGCVLVYANEAGTAAYVSATVDGGARWSTPVKLLAPALDVSVALSCTTLRSCVAVLSEVGAAPKVLSTTNGWATTAKGTWSGPTEGAKDLGLSLFGPMSCSATACLTFDEGSFISSRAWNELDRALR